MRTQYLLYSGLVAYVPPMTWWNNLLETNFHDHVNAPWKCAWSAYVRSLLGIHSPPGTVVKMRDPGWRSVRNFTCTIHQDQAISLSALVRFDPWFQVLIREKCYSTKQHVPTFLAAWHFLNSRTYACMRSCLGLLRPGRTTLLRICQDIIHSDWCSARFNSKGKTAETSQRTRYRS